MKSNFFVFFIAIFMSVSSITSFNSCTGSDNSSKDATENNTENTEKDNTNLNSSAEVIQLTTEEFKTKVFNYDTNETWNYLGDLPCVIDFYADWCKPCRMVAPIMDELAKEYDGKVIFYKIDVDKEGGLSGYFGIQSIPSVLFIPGDNSQPSMATGAMPKQDYINAIKDVLKVEK